MSEELTIKEIKGEIVRRGWELKTNPDNFGCWWATIEDLTIETKENLYLAPILSRWDETEADAIRGVYGRAIEYLPALPALYDEHGIEYKIKAVQND